MEQLMHDFLVHILGPLILPFFMVVCLCLIADIRPEPIIGGMLQIFAAAIHAIGQLLLRVLFAPARRGQYPRKPETPRHTR